MRGADQGVDGPVVNDQQPVFVQPLSGTNKQLLTVSASGHLVAQFSHQGAALMLAHPSELKGLARNLLVVEQGTVAAIHRTQRCEFRGVDAELGAEVAPQHRWDDAKGVEQTPAHPQNTHVQRQAKLQSVTAPRLDQFALGRAKGKEGLQLEGADLARQLAHVQVRRLPALHRAPPSLGRSPYASTKRTAMSAESMTCYLAPAPLLALRTVPYYPENK